MARVFFWPKVLNSRAELVERQVIHQNTQNFPLILPSDFPSDFPLILPSDFPSDFPLILRQKTPYLWPINNFYKILPLFLRRRFPEAKQLKTAAITSKFIVLKQTFA